MTPVDIYALFVLPALLVVGSGGFLIYTRRQERVRAQRAQAEADRRLAAIEGRLPHLKVVNN